MKTLKILILALVIFEFTFAGNHKPVFQIKPENIDFLRYFFISNLYDSAKVIYKFGEVKLISGDNTNFINLVHSLDTVEGKSRFGTSEQGISYDLQSLARTENFVIPNTGFPKITFFRGINESGQPGKPDRYFYGYGKGEWDIADRTEFVLQLVNANDDVVMAVLDSVVSMPNSDPQADSLFGTNPYIVFHEWAIPPLYWDSTVYLRVSPRRYGPTPLGLIMSEQSLWANYGSLVDLSGANLGMENQNMLDSLCWLELTSYLDSVILATGKLPHHNYHIPQKHFYEHRQKYYSDWAMKIINQDTIYTKSYSNSDYKYTDYDLNNKSHKESIKIHKIYFERDTLFVEINSLIMTRAKIKIFGNSKRESIEVWKGAIKVGENEIKASITNLPTGYYLVIFEDINRVSSKSALEVGC